MAVLDGRFPVRGASCVDRFTCDRRIEGLGPLGAKAAEVLPSDASHCLGGASPHPFPHSCSEDT